MHAQIIETFNALKQHKPLVHNITNFVVMNNTANALLALGASPVMAHAKEELDDILSIASSLVINMGTLDKRWLKAMLKASKIAQQLNKPWVFDPVGAGASGYRTASALALVEQNPPTVIRANASEVMALAKHNVLTKGVDSTEQSNVAMAAARSLVAQYQSTLVISGATDIILSSKGCSQIHNGSQVMTQVTGMGCTASALTGACIAVTDDSHLAAVTAMAIMGVCGEIAQQHSTGPGSFQVAFLDALYRLTAEQLSTMLRIEHNNDHEY